MDLVQDNIGKVPKKLLPALMIGEDPPVEHVGIGKEDIGNLFSDLLAPVGRGVSVVNLRCDLFPLDPLGQEKEILQLILLEGL